MKRNIDGIRGEFFDLLVIGGGIHGAVIAYKAAQKGFKVLLAEKQDFASATSSNSLKILHGGLRYLQTLDFKRMRDSVVSRREMMQMAPHLVRPLPCALPAYGHGIKGKEVMRAAMLMNDLVSFDRNRELHRDRRLPAGHCISKQKCLEWIPGLPRKGLHGASIWYDALALNTERMVLEYILAACELGTTALNYLGVESLSRTENGHLEATLHDHIADTPLTISTQYVINSAGAQFESFTEDHVPASAPSHWARALNIVVRKNLFPHCAVALEQKIEERKRMLFLVPWRSQYTLIGTHYLEQERDRPLFPVQKEHLQALVDEINMLYPDARLSYSDITYYHAGLLPADTVTTRAKKDQPVMKKASSIIDHASHGGLPNVFSLNSIKYTTAPRVAESILSLLPSSPSAHHPTAITREAPVPQSARDRQLQEKYGARWFRLRPYVEAAPDPLDEHTQLLRGEIDYFMREEMALHLDDIVFRRSDLGTAECPSIKTLNEIAQIAGNEYSWTTQQLNAEIEKVLQRYAPLETAIPTTE